MLRKGFFTIRSELEDAMAPREQLTLQHVALAAASLLGLLGEPAHLGSRSLQAQVLALPGLMSCHVPGDCADGSSCCRTCQLRRELPHRVMAVRHKLRNCWTLPKLLNSAPSHQASSPVLRTQTPRAWQYRRCACMRRNDRQHSNGSSHAMHTLGCMAICKSHLRL